MKKIPTIFVRDWDGNPKYVTRESNPECAWVFAGQGVATRKYDGTCVLYDGVSWWARREVKPGKTPPPGFQSITTDEATGKTIGWEPIHQSAFAKYFEQALDLTRCRFDPTPTGTYELVGPRINGNPERQEQHTLIRHADAEVLSRIKLTYEGIHEATRHLAKHNGAEGIVWHHSDGRMAKIKARDFPSQVESAAPTTTEEGGQ